jgi:hypothetical protein
MSRSNLLRRAGATLVASAVTISLVAAGGAAQAAPADRGADWLSGQLDGGLIPEPFQQGLTIDVGLALKAIGGHDADLQELSTAMEGEVGNYTGTGDEIYAGPSAKLLVLAQATGADATDFGGANLVRRLNGLVTKSGPAKGRIVDQSEFGDYANSLGQILAVRGLSAAGSGYAGMTRAFLLEQQCADGYFRLSFNGLNSNHQSCGKKSPADPDVTAYAVIQLWKTSKGHSAFRNHLKKAVAWLAQGQRKSGAFVGGTTTATPNTNSTGLAAWALALTGRCTPAKHAAQWINDLQVGPQSGGSPLSGQRGAIAYDRAALKAGKSDGITTDTADQWRRASSQAAPALQYLHGC